MTEEAARNSPEPWAISTPELDRRPASRLGRASRHRGIALAVIALTYLVYVVSPFKNQTDSIWTIPTVASLLSEGNADLDEYASTLEAHHQYAIQVVRGRHYSFFPLGPVLAALPLVGGVDALLHALRSIAGPRLPTWAEHQITRWEGHFHARGDIDVYFFDVTELLVASFYAATAIGFVFLTARRRVPLAPALALAGIAAFGTMAYSTASRVLWEHGPSMFLLSVAVYLVTRPNPTRRSTFLLGMVVACAYAARPTNAVTAVGFTLYLALTQRRQVLLFLAGAGVVAVPFCLHSLSTYGGLLPPYFLGSRLRPSPRLLLEALAGNLVSPARGLLVWSPVLLVGLVDLTKRVRHREREPVEVLFGSILAVHWVAISAFPHWWGGYCIGPRFFTDMVPYLVYFLAPPLARVFAAPKAHRTSCAVLALLVMVSVFAHASGAWTRSVMNWNVTPVSVDKHPERLWDWTDVQFLRPLRGR